MPSQGGGGGGAGVGSGVFSGEWRAQQVLNSVNDCRKWFVSLEVAPARSQCPSQKLTCSSLKIDCAKHQGALGNLQPQFPRQGAPEKSEMPPFLQLLCGLNQHSLERVSYASSQVSYPQWPSFVKNMTAAPVIFFPRNFNRCFKLHMHSLPFSNGKEVCIKQRIYQKLPALALRQRVPLAHLVDCIKDFKSCCE